MEQTAHGGADGWMRHRASGSAPEQPVPRKISDDGGGEAPAAAPPAGLVGAGSGSVIAGEILGFVAAPARCWFGSSEFERGSIGLVGSWSAAAVPVLFLASV